MSFNHFSTQKLNFWLNGGIVHRDIYLSYTGCEVLLVLPAPRCTASRHEFKNQINPTIV